MQEHAGHVLLNDYMSVSRPQKRQPLPLSPQNYPLHGSEVNLPTSFHQASAGYGVPNHTPPISTSDGIMGKSLHPDATTNQRAALGFAAATCSRFSVSELLTFTCKLELHSLLAVSRAGNPGSSGAEIGKALASVSLGSHSVSFTAQCGDKLVVDHFSEASYHWWSNQWLIWTIILRYDLITHLLNYYLFKIYFGTAWIFRGNFVKLANYRLVNQVLPKILENSEFKNWLFLINNNFNF